MAESEQYAKSVYAAIEKRRSVRHFQECPLEEEKLRKILAAGIAAPSGSNWQNQRFLVLTDKDEILHLGRWRFVWPYKSPDKNRIQQEHPGGIIGGAAAAIVVFSDSLNNDKRGNGEYYIWETLECQNCAASIENMLIMATALGVGSCWVSASDKMSYTRLLLGQSWRNVLSNYCIPSYYKLQGIVILGYPKAYDEDGFPKGEKMHGATVWRSTERRPVDYYLIRERNPLDPSAVEVSLVDAFAIRAFRLLIEIFQRVCVWCDKRIHQLEVEKYLERKSDRS